ncbi:Patatin-like phospholipase/acyl hydrolase [Algoriella xinjiangensis]|uniref:Patatin-like phospholipase/acyl hydrolase n=1 Tax=Algoriella xinjiangensis TaxID=684065 RepID=A0A1I4WND7_9FLAO|nr:MULTISPECIES: patatin-like phospholipase family protein [Algoriella]MBO6212694.1 patatin-like phospholipase family protein [Algoriella sp.]SFN15035.1 Patatin-like phospholipase/acyl hydrolase [Algoriella xinjiangensis]VDH16788.1 Patatin [Algoriella xinjiangensis]
MEFKEKKIILLSLDGGGIRGIISCVILKYIEDKLKEQDCEDAKIGDYVDFIAGTSTGALIASLLLLPSDEHPKKAKHSITDALNIYLGEGKNIFSKTFWTILNNPLAVFKDNFSTVVLESQLELVFKKTELKNLIRPCALVAYDTEHQKPKIFNSIDGISPFRNFYIKDVCRASSAAPTYFEPAKIKSFAEQEFSCIDGGVFANNPTFCGFIESQKINFSKYFKDALKFDGTAPLQEFVTISIGNGSRAKSYKHSELAGISKSKWVDPLVDIFISTGVNMVDMEMKSMYDLLKPKYQHNYYRFNPEIPESSIDLGNVSNANIKTLLDVANDYVAKNKEYLDEVVQKLIINKIEIQ